MRSRSFQRSQASKIHDRKLAYELEIVAGVLRPLARCTELQWLDELAFRRKKSPALRGREVRDAIAVTGQGQLTGHYSLIGQTCKLAVRKTCEEHSSV